MKDYFATAVLDLDFVKSSTTADAAVKTVLGLLTSTVEESTGREMTREFPAGLTYDRLRGHQRRLREVSVNDCVKQVAVQLDVAQESANVVVRRVLSVAGQSLNPDSRRRLERTLPADWRGLLQSA